MYEWSFKFLNKSARVMVFGLDSSNGKLKNADFSDAFDGINAGLDSHQYIGISTSGAVYCVSSVNRIIHPHLYKDDHIDSERIFDTEKKIHIILDTKTKELLFRINDKPQQHPFATNIDIIKDTFRLAIAIPIVQTEWVQLIDFKIYHNY